MFYWTDALSGISSGTTINYVDVINGTDITSYGNIIGSVLIYNKDNTYAVSAVFRNASGNKVGLQLASGVNLNSVSNYKHRVFYI